MSFKFQPDYNLSVSRADLEAAIKKITKKARAKDPNVFEISYLMGRMMCRSLDGKVDIAAAGEWGKPVKTSGFAMKKLAARLPDADPIRLGFYEGRLFVESFSLPAGTGT